MHIYESDLIVSDPTAQEVRDTYARKAAVSDKLTNMSQITSKTFISTLQRQLDEERNARTKLESELKVLKDLSAEIS
jgi:predicted  nucleic acid-binding Zn-ribbon protein